MLMENLLKLKNPKFYQKNAIIPSIRVILFIMVVGGIPYTAHGAQIPPLFNFYFSCFYVYFILG